MDKSCPECQAQTCLGIKHTIYDQTVCCNCMSDPPKGLCLPCNDRRVAQDERDAIKFWKENKISPRPLWAKDWYPWEKEVRDLVGDLQNENKLLKEEILDRINSHPALFEEEFLAEAHRLVDDEEDIEVDLF